MILIAKVTIVFAAALVATALARRATAATRHAILAASQLAVLIVPMIVPIVPKVRVDVGPMLTRPVPAAAPVLRLSREPKHNSGIPLVPMLWLGVALAIAATRGIALARAIGIARRARPHGDVFLTDAIDQPATLGTRILLPADAPSWDAARLEAVLRHERAHVARRDWLAQLIGDLACAAYWFHPLAWIVARKAALERERACDDVVVRGGVDPVAYAATLLDVARGLGRLPMAMAMAGQPHLERRVRAILDATTPRRRASAAFLVIILCTAIALPAVAALAPKAAALLPIEPDHLFEPWTSPQSERIEGIPATFRVQSSDPLIARFNDAAALAPRAEDDLVGERARWVLMRSGGGDVVPPLVAALQDSDWRVRSHASWGLGIAADRRATAALLPLLDDPIWRVRAMAAYALAEIGDPAAAEAMTGMLDDAAWQVRVEAVQYLDRIGSIAALEPMLDDRHIAVRNAAEEALLRRR